MNQEIFDACYEEWKLDRKNVKYWEKLGRRFDKTPEALRNWFKRERKKRGIFRGIQKSSSGIYIEDKPRIGIFDIETLPMVAYVWRMFDQNISLDQVISETGLLSWAAKFLNESEIYSDILTSKEAPLKDSKRIAKSCWDFLSKCDVVIGHNVMSFDLKHMNTFFLKYGLSPLKYVIVDTLSVARNNFNFDSNKLKFINQKLDIKQKIDNAGFELWRDCHQGMQTALDTMLEYNIGDIYATEELFYKVRPYVRNFNIALYNETLTNQCPVCGSTDLKSEGFYYTPAGKWESVRCQECKCISRKKQNLFDKHKKRSLLINS